MIPADNARGGITNFYQTIKKYFPPNIIYQYRGSRTFPFRKNFSKEFKRIFVDYFYFLFTILTKNVTLIQTTTSLNPNALCRDAIFIILSKLFRKKTVVFFRGWDIDYADKIEGQKLFKYVFFKADSFIVLTDNAEKTLKRWGYKKNIYRGTTAVGNHLIQNLTKESIKNKFENDSKKIKLLYLARIEKRKGIYELIDTLQILNTIYDNIILTIAGDGREEKAIREYISKKNIKNVTFTGFVNNEEKVKVFNNNHIYIFPSYTEGMPTSVLEAMAFGLPVITTAVGGLIDFFQNGTNGFMSEVPPKPSKFAKNIMHLIENQELMKSIALNNFIYAQNTFLASKIAKQNENIFNEVINKNK